MRRRLAAANTRAVVCESHGRKVLARRETNAPQADGTVLEQRIELLLHPSINHRLPFLQCSTLFGSVACCIVVTLKQAQR